MRKLIPALAIVALASFVSFSPASAARLDSAQCRPLSSDNAGDCCAAANWKKLVRSADRAICLNIRRGEPLSKALSASVNAAQPPATPPGGTNNPPADPPGTTAKGINNGFGNGDQDAPGSSKPHNNAENDSDSRTSP